MKTESRTFRSLVSVAVLGGLVLFAFAATAEAGITLSNGGYKGTGDPEAHYDLSVYLDPGSTLVAAKIDPSKDDFFTLNDLPGIKGPADFKFLLGGKEQPWGAAFGLSTLTTLTVNGVKHKVDATDVTFDYLGTTSITNSGSTPLLLGKVKIFEDDYPKMPVLPAGYQINITYDYKVKDSITGQNEFGTNIPFTFTVAPEPSSFVITTLVGSCVAGVALLRKWRRAA